MPNDPPTSGSKPATPSEQAAEAYEHKRKEVEAAVAAAIPSETELQAQSALDEEVSLLLDPPEAEEPTETEKPSLHLPLSSSLGKQHSRRQKYQAYHHSHTHGQQ